MPEIDPLPKIVISSAQPLNTAGYRGGGIFQTADPDRQIPEVTLASAPLRPLDRTHSNEQRISISDKDGVIVGSFGLVQQPNSTWIRGINIAEERQNERLGVATYIGVIAALHSVGRTLRSDPSGLSEHSTRVWSSLERRGVAQQTGEYDQHGHPRYVSAGPRTDS